MKNFFHKTLGKIFPNNLSFFTLPKALLSFVFSIVISITMLSFLSWITYSNLQEMSKRTEDVTHTYQARFKNKELIKLLVDAETGQRGYLLTGNEDFLKPFHESKEKIDSTLHEFSALISESPSQIQRLDSIKTFAGSRLKAMEMNIDRIQKGQSVDTVKLYLGKFYMDKIRTLSEKIDTDEEDLLQHRKELQQSSDENMTYYLLGLSVVTLLFLGLFFAYFISNLNSEFHYKQPSKTNYGKLSIPMPNSNSLRILLRTIYKNLYEKLELLASDFTLDKMMNLAMKQKIIS